MSWFENTYARAFIDGDPNFMDHYVEPIYLVVGEEARSLSREEFGAAVDEIYVQPWIASGWVTTALIDVDVTRLSSDSAQVTAAWAILDKQGRNVTGCGTP